MPPIEDNRRLKKPRSCILRDRGLLDATGQSQASFGSEFLAVRSLLKKLYAYAYAYALMRTLPHKHRICVCFSLELPFLKRLYSNVCRIFLRVFSLTNIGFVQCLSLSPLLSLYAYLCHVMLCVLCLSNIYVMSFSITLCCFNSFMRTLMRLCVLCFTNIGFVSAFPSGSLFLNVCTLMFVAFCYAYFPSQTSGLCSAFPSAPC